MNNKEIKKIGELILFTQKKVVTHTLSYWKPEAERIIQTKSKDINAIEHTLDGLCEAAFDDEVLLVFKKLCRYYYDIDPVATAQQIEFYRELWDEDWAGEDR